MANDPSDSAHAAAGSASSRRVDVRVVLKQPITLLMGDGSQRPATTVDVSQRGMSLTTDKPITPGSRCRVVVQAAALGQPGTVEIAAKAVYSSYVAARHFRIGVVFSEGEAQAVALIQALMAGSQKP